MPRLIVIYILLLSLNGYGQDVTVDLLDMSPLTGQADPLDPIIFHLNLENSGEETLGVRVVKHGIDRPEDWDISICTTACLPPDQDTAVTYVGAGLSESVSLYFFASSVGSSTASLSFYYLDTEILIASFEVMAIAEPTGIEEGFTSLPSFAQIASDKIVLRNAAGYSYAIVDILGQVLLEGEVENLEEVIHFPFKKSWIYLIDLQAVSRKRTVFSFIPS